MIGIFKPVNNAYWYDIREFEVINWKPWTYRWVAIADYQNQISTLPVFKPKIQCADMQEYLDQFKQYWEWSNQINLF